MLKWRVLTAAVLIPFVVWGIFALPQLYFSVVATVIVGLLAWEWSTLLGCQKHYERLIYVVAVLVTLMATRFLAYLLQAEFMIYFSAIFWLIAAGYIIYITYEKTYHAWSKGFIAGVGLLLLTACWAALIVLHRQPKWLLFMLILIWLTDTFAYFGGKFLGKNKLSEIISPNKTREGFFVGSGLTFITGLVLLWFWITPGEITGLFVVITIVTILISVIGDLFESLLKRQAAVKDSGQLLPGHGGILDRLDSLLAAAPIFASSLLLFTNVFI